MKKIVIIGGGIAGLSAGIFAGKNGFESIILEKNPVPGGECTGWDRKGYHIDGCIHWLVGTKPGSDLNDLWNTVGALEGVDIYNPETFLSFEHDGHTVHFYRDLEKLRLSWLEISPEDADAVDTLCREIQRLQTFEIPAGKPMDMMNVFEKIRFFTSMKEAGTVMKKYGRITQKEYAETFRHPALRAAMSSLSLLPDGFSAASIFFGLAAFTKGDASVPRGGSREFARRMARRYLELGGTIEASCEAVELKISGADVTSVTCSDGRVFEADYFIAACDAEVLYERLLKGKYPDPKYRRRYENPEQYPLASQVLVSLGYESTLKDFPRSLSFPTDPIQIGSTQVDRILMNQFSHEPGFAPEGHSVITTVTNQMHEDYDFWNDLAGDRSAYRKEKERIGRDIIKAVEKRFPEMKGKLKVIDTATPKTYERYCNAYRGAFMPFLPTVSGKSMEHTGNIKGLRNIMLSGQWLQPPGGLPPAVLTGKYSIMRICRKERQPFTG